MALSPTMAVPRQHQAGRQKDLSPELGTVFYGVQPRHLASRDKTAVWAARYGRYVICLHQVCGQRPELILHGELLVVPTVRGVLSLVLLSLLIRLLVWGCPGFCQRRRVSTFTSCLQSLLVRTNERRSTNGGFSASPVLLSLLVCTAVGHFWQG